MYDKDVPNYKELSITLFHALLFQLYDLSLELKTINIKHPLLLCFTCIPGMLTYVLLDYYTFACEVNLKDKQTHQEFTQN